MVAPGRWLLEQVVARAGWTVVESSTSAMCLGIHINTEDRTMSIPPDKLQEIIQS